MRITLIVVVLVLSACSSEPIATAESEQRTAHTDVGQPTARDDTARDDTARDDTAQSVTAQSVTAQSDTAENTAADLTMRQRPSGLSPEGPTEEDFPHLHNLLQVTQRIYSGGAPKDEQAFGELARLGVRTVVSVDGARPKLELAEQYGLRYVHIPIGYDGVPGDAAKLLARLVKDAEGPFYIHCHHGKHRGPAAAAVACIADGDADGKSALAILERAGTSKGYGGLWRDVEAYTPLADDDDAPELVSVAEVGSLAAAMVQMDRASYNLELCEAAGWRTPADHPDISPSQEALLLKEGFRETVRKLTQYSDYDDQFFAWMNEAESAATTLESALRAGNTARAISPFSAIQNQCKQCHAAYRN